MSDKETLTPEEKRIFKALKLAVEYGWIPEKVDNMTYLKNIERMRELLSLPESD